jgi:hypothetical protein
MPIETKIVVTGGPKGNKEIKKFAKTASTDINKLEKQSTVSSKKMSAAFAGIGSSLGALGVGVGIGAAAIGFKKIINLASDTEESLNKVREVFGSAATSVEKFSETAAKGIGASRQEALAMTSEIGNLLVAFGFAEQKAGDVSTQMVQLAADLGSFNNVPTVDALNAIRSALVGESEPIRRFGADVRQARLDQIALAEGLEFTKGKMDSQTKALAAMKAIMLDTAKAQGDFARTGDQLANASKTLSALTRDLGSDLGEIFLPVVREAVLGLSDMVSGVKDFLKAGKEEDKTLAALKHARAEIGFIDEQIGRLMKKEGVQGLVNKLIDPSKDLTDLWSKRWDWQRKINDLLLSEGKKHSEIITVVDKDKTLRDEILASVKLQQDRLRIINQLKTEGLIPLSEEERLQAKIAEKMAAAEPILEVLDRTHFSIAESLKEDLFHTQMMANAQARWTEEAEQTRQVLFEAAGILNEIAQLASGKRKFSFSGLLGIGAGIATILGGAGIAAGLQAGSIATRGFQGGGRPGVGEDVIVGERGPEIFRADRPGRIIPNSQINNNQKVELHMHFAMADELTVKTKVIPIINDYVERQGGKLVSSKVA